MSTDLKERQERIRLLKDGIIDTVNKRISEASKAVSEREKNLLLNDFEYSLGKISLRSTPEGVGIGAHYLCNAKCMFCLGGKPKLFSMERYKDFFEPRLGPVISKSRYLNLCGFGELLLMPEIEKFIDYINMKIPKVNKIYTTNGTPLINDKILTRLTETKSGILISLHAHNSQLHKLLTKTNAFDQIVSSIRRLVSLRRDTERPSITLVFLINTLNIEALPEFVKFAAGLGVDEVTCNYLTVFHYSQLKLSCFFKQEITNHKFNEAKEHARGRNFILNLPPAFGTTEDSSKKPSCSDPWKYFYVENETSVLPCCHAGSHVGYLANSDFESIWNGSGYKYLRKSLTEGPIHEWCKYCYKYRSDNVNDIRSHINFRPGFQDKILKGYKL